MKIDRRKSPGNVQTAGDDPHAHAQAHAHTHAQAHTHLHTHMHIRNKLWIPAKKCAHLAMDNELYCYIYSDLPVCFKTFQELL